MSSVAIVGSGLAGIGAALAFLQKGFQVTFFSEDGVIGGGATAACAGLLHPYPGRRCSRSPQATEALASFQKVKTILGLQEGEHFVQGVYLIPSLEEQFCAMRQHSQTYRDVQQIDSFFLISSGLTLRMDGYLSRFKEYFFSKGGRVLTRKISFWEELLDSFDLVILATGSGSSSFLSTEKWKRLKGQVLLLQGNSQYHLSCVGGGLCARLSSEQCMVGSTYERTYRTLKPDMKEARHRLQAPLEAFAPQAEIVGCQAGERFFIQERVFPTIKQLHSRGFLFAGLGSRGLLYHVLGGQMLSALVEESFLKKSQA